MWITILVVVLLNGQSEIMYSVPETHAQCETRRVNFNKSALLEIKAGAPIRSVNSACIPVDGDSLRKAQ